MRVSNIDFGLSENNGDFPSWFTNNDWHKLIYVAYSAADVPGAAVACVAGAPCLTLDELDNLGIIIAPPNVNDDNNAIVIAAGMEINQSVSSDCVTPLAGVQDRSNGTINEYYELENCDQLDDNFHKQFTTNTFNDQVRIIEP